MRMIIDPREIELTTEQRAELASLAATTGKPWSDVLRDALNRYRAETAVPSHRLAGESLLAAATRLGLVGCVKGGPPDLSTNPQYMAGFGDRRG